MYFYDYKMGTKSSITHLLPQPAFYIYTRPEQPQSPLLDGLPTALPHLSLLPVRYHVDLSKKLNACIRFFLHMVSFNLNTKQCYLQITHNNIYSCRYMYKHDDSLPTHPLLPGLISTFPFQYSLTPIFTYLEILLLLLVVRIPIHSSPWIAINCSPLAVSPIPRHPTYQVTYLHRRHQQYQPSRLTHYPFVSLGGLASLSKCGTRSTHLFFIGTDLDEHAMDNTYFTEQSAHLRFYIVNFYLIAQQ